MGANPTETLEAIRQQLGDLPERLAAVLLRRREEDKRREELGQHGKGEQDDSAERFRQTPRSDLSEVLGRLADSLGASGLGSMIRRFGDLQSAWKDLGRLMKPAQALKPLPPSVRKVTTLAPSSKATAAKTRLATASPYALPTSKTVVRPPGRATALAPLPKGRKTRLAPGSTGRPLPPRPPAKITYEAEPTRRLPVRSIQQFKPLSRPTKLATASPPALPARKTMIQPEAARKTMLALAESDRPPQPDQSLGAMPSARTLSSRQAMPASESGVPAEAGTRIKDLVDAIKELVAVFKDNKRNASPDEESEPPKRKRKRKEPLDRTESGVDAQNASNLTHAMQTMFLGVFSKGGG